MARNIIFLLVALVVENPDEAIDCITHLWYSTLVRDSDIDILSSHVRPLVNEICDKIQSKPSGALLAKSWTFGSRSLRVVLERSFWNRLLSYLKAPAGLTAEQSQKLRAEIVLASLRRDYRDRHMSFFSPAQRISFHGFRQDGLLLPFGMWRGDFVHPNPYV